MEKIDVRLARHNWVWTRQSIRVRTFLSPSYSRRQRRLSRIEGISLVLQNLAQSSPAGVHTRGVPETKKSRSLAWDFDGKGSAPGRQGAVTYLVLSMSSKFVPSYSERALQPVSHVFDVSIFKPQGLSAFAANRGLLRPASHARIASVQRLRDRPTRRTHPRGQDPCFRPNQRPTRRPVVPRP